MNAVNTVLKSFACGLGALAITVAFSWSLVQYTASSPRDLTAAVTSHTVPFKMKSRHVWFGQSLPAVLVD